MFSEHTTVGLGVGARSVVAEAVNWDTEQVFGRMLTPATHEVLAWVGELPGPRPKLQSRGASPPAYYAR